MSEKYKPFEYKPEKEKVGYKKKVQKWEEQIDNTDDDISHRRFNCTLHANQILTAYKRCVHKNEYSKENLMTSYRVTLAKLLADPSLSEDEFLSLYSVIQSRAQKVYSERAKRLRQAKM